jgi:aryl-alcohol dehydrogenase-like predicted oxidoreductase
MEYRRLGASGLRVPALSFGTGTFGGGNDFFKAWGSTDAGGASRLIDICLDHGVSMFDSADVYSSGLAETILGEAIKSKRDRLLISTKATFPGAAGDGPNAFGSSRQHLINAVDSALKRLGTDHIDLFQLHGQDVGAVVWSPLGWGKLTGKIRRGQPAKPGTRAHDIAGTGPSFAEEHLFRIVDALDAVADETGKSIPQVALAWLLGRPTVSTLIVGARDEAQLLENIGATGWSLTAEQVAILDTASDQTPAYPVWHQRGFPMLNERG